MQRYAELVRAGSHTEHERRQLLESHHTRVVTHIEELQRHLAVIDHKLNLYRSNQTQAG